VTAPKWHTAHAKNFPALHPVFNVPPPTIVIQPTPPVASAVKPSKMSRVWSSAKVAGPFTVAVVAIAFSWFNYRDQHSADHLQAQTQTAANATTLNHDAEQVSWYTTPKHDIVLVNASTGVISDIKMLIGNNDADDDVERMPEVPACSTVTISAAGIPINKGQAWLRNAEWPDDLFFADRHQQYWDLSGNGALFSAIADPFNWRTDVISSRFTTTRSTATCS
jgi:hypothetical protein